MTRPPYFQNPDLDASPFFYSGNSTGVLLLHGYTATPAETVLLANYLREKNYTVSAPCLPGHGTTIEDLHGYRWTDWTAHVEQAYLDLQAQCDQVFIAGESLGSLLALYVATRQPQIKGLILFSPAFRVRGWRISLAPFLRPFVHQLKKKQSTGPTTTVSKRWQGYSIDSFPALAEVLTLQRTVQQQMHSIKQPILVFLGRQDQKIYTHDALSLPAQVASNDIQCIWMEKSAHCIMLDVEWESAAQMTHNFIQRIERAA